MERAIFGRNPRAKSPDKPSFHNLRTEPHAGKDAECGRIGAYILSKVHL